LLKAGLPPHPFPLPPEEREKNVLFVKERSFSLPEEERNIRPPIWKGN
jgi:hypothetical protein